METLIGIEDNDLRKLSRNRNLWKIILKDEGFFYESYYKSTETLKYRHANQETWSVMPSYAVHWGSDGSEIGRVSFWDDRPKEVFTIKK